MDAEPENIPAPRIKIAVIGLYRSGSSALVAVLEKLGV